MNAAAGKGMEAAMGLAAVKLEQVESFAGSREGFEGLVTRLSSRDAMTMTHEDLEEMVLGQGPLCQHLVRQTAVKINV